MNKYLNKFELRKATHKKNCLGPFILITNSSNVCVLSASMPNLGKIGKIQLKGGTQLCLIIILCCWLWNYFCNINVNSFLFCYICFFFTRKHDEKSVLVKVHTEAKFQGLQLLPKAFFFCVIAKLRNIDFCFS